MEMLKRVLRSNGLYSIITGLVAVVLAGRLAETMGIDTWIVAGVGGAVVLFGIGLLLFFRGDAVDLKSAWAVVIADDLWVAGAIAVIALGLMTTEGNLILASVSVPVAIFAVLQFVGIRRVQVGS